MRISPSRFVLGVLFPSRAGVVEYETLITVDGAPRPAIVFEPSKPGMPRPGWILLHGMTVPGRHHAGVFRFGRALAAAGAVAICPEVSEWTQLLVDPGPVHPTLVAASEALTDRGDVASDRIAALAFSIGVPATLAAASKPPLSTRLAAIGGFGASCDMHRTVRCMLTGEHEWRGTSYHLQPDPYGRWIVGANFLQHLPSDAWGSLTVRRAVAERLQLLAVTAGRNGAYSDDPIYDPLKARLADALPDGARRLWALFAPPSRHLPDDASAAGSLADALADVMVRRHPEFDARPKLGRVAARVQLVHGYADQLVPFTETLRLVDAFPAGRPARATITRLFGHARRETQGSGEPLSPAGYPGELWRLNRALRELALSV